SFVFFSCEESPESIQGALFTDEETPGGGQFTAPTFLFNFTFDFNSNGVINWGETNGFDFYVQNYSNPLPLTNISIQISGFSNSGFIADYDDEPSSITSIDAGGVAQPSYSWCVDYARTILLSCTQPNDDYVGNFYFNTANTNFGNQSLDITMFIQYTYDGTAYSTTYTQSVNIF
ncbi:MAG: hypothetical protein MI700_06415, partial [Balneolales bacterium]|nr:hypothetical protein [Balneolales bacterium]